MDLASAVGSRATSLLAVSSRYILSTVASSKVKGGSKTAKSLESTRWTMTTKPSQLTLWGDSQGSSTQKSGSTTLPEEVEKFSHQRVQVYPSSSLGSTHGSNARHDVKSKAQDILTAYKYFCTIDVDVSGRIEGRNLLRLLTDVAQHPREDKVLTFTVVVPELDCGLRFEEHEDGRGGSYLTVDSIEDQSPAMFIKQLAVGLRLVEVQHIPIHSIKDLTAATKTIVATQKKAGSVGSTNVVFRFQEPAYIVDRYNNALDMQVVIPPSARRRKLLTANKSAAAAAVALASASRKISIQLTLPSRAYNTREEFVDMLQRKLTDASDKAGLPGHFDVLLNQDDDIVFRNNRCQFQMLFKSGERSQCGVHTLLGFDHEDTREAKEHLGQRPRVTGVDLSQLSRKQFEELGDAIMMRYDASSDGVMNFEEFYSFYTEFLTGRSKMLQLGAWIKSQFLSEEEQRKKEADAKEAIERERRKGDIERLREKNREIRAKQWEEIKKKLVKDQDGQTRRRPKEKRASPTRLRRKQPLGQVRQPTPPQPPVQPPPLQPPLQPLQQPPPPLQQLLQTQQPTQQLSQTQQPTQPLSQTQQPTQQLSQQPTQQLSQQPTPQVSQQPMEPPPPTQQLSQTQPPTQQLSQQPTQPPPPTQQLSQPPLPTQQLSQTQPPTQQLSQAQQATQQLSQTQPAQQQQQQQQQQPPPPPPAQQEQQQTAQQEQQPQPEQQLVQTQPSLQQEQEHQQQQPAQQGQQQKLQQQKPAQRLLQTHPPLRQRQQQKQPPLQYLSQTHPSLRQHQQQSKTQPPLQKLSQTQPPLQQPGTPEEQQPPQRQETPSPSLLAQQLAQSEDQQQHPPPPTPPPEQSREQQPAHDEQGKQEQRTTATPEKLQQTQAQEQVQAVQQPKQPEQQQSEEPPLQQQQPQPPPPQQDDGPKQVRLQEPEATSRPVSDGAGEGGGAQGDDEADGLDGGHLNVKEAPPETAEAAMIRTRLEKRRLAKSIKQTQRARPTILMSTLLTQAAHAKGDSLHLMAKKDKAIVKMAQEYGTDLIALEKPALMHPAFFGYLTLRNHRPACDPAVLHPIFFNHKHIVVNKSSTAKMVGIKQILKDVIAGPAEYSTRVWKYFPYPRVDTVIIRQRLRSALPRLYDEGHIIHPACFGCMMVSEEPPDPAVSHPAHVGFRLQRKPLSDPHSRKLLYLLVRDRAHRLPCDVCTISKPGCPACWEMPLGFTPSDFEFTGPIPPPNQRPSGPLPPIHTKLTTARAIYWHRKLFCDYITLYVKSLPYGAVTVLQVEKAESVAYLYHLFLSNCPYGINEAGCALYIPHSRGCFSIDNTFLPASDLANELDTGREPLTSYNLRMAPSRVLLLHVQTLHLEHSQGSMNEYIRLTLNRPLTPGYGVIYELNHIPARWDDDPVQQALLHVVDEQLDNLHRYTELRANFRPPGASKKGMVREDPLKMTRLQRLRDERKHEVHKILNLQQILITEGGTRDLSVVRSANEQSRQAVNDKLRRQRYRKHRRESLERMQLEWERKQEEERKKKLSENLFVTLAATRTQHMAMPGDDDPQALYADLN